MRAEPPDRLTVRVMELLEEAQHSSLTHAEVIEELVLSLRRDLAYLARRARRGRQTVYDEVEERALRARARAIVLLQAQQEAGHRLNIDKPICDHRARLESEAGDVPGPQPQRHALPGPQ